MSFIYPRTITIKRPNSQAQAGFSGQYLGTTSANETVIATGLSASIQATSKGGKAETELPSDTRRSYFNVFIPQWQAALGTINPNDRVIDDLGQIYQVDTSYWNSLGYKLTTYLLDA